MSLKITLNKEQLEQELAKNAPMTPGWYEFDLTDVTVTKAKDLQSMNYVVTHVPVGKPDKAIKHYFNSKPFGQTFMVKFFAALHGMPVQEFMTKVGTEIALDFELVKGKKVMGKVIHGLGDGANAGKIFNNIEDWAPVGKVPF